MRKALDALYGASAGLAALFMIGVLVMVLISILDWIFLNVVTFVYAG